MPLLFPVVHVACSFVYLGITLEVSCALLEMLIVTPIIPGVVCHTLESYVSA
jgi:hypothetical protein